MDFPWVRFNRVHLPRQRQPSSPPLLSIFILSATALSYEVLLIRLFSIIHWHHFAFMVISIALLGYGASGSLITVFREKLLANYNTVFVANILLFGMTSISCFIIVQQLPFNTLEILWDSSQWQRLLLSYLLLTLPFFFVANAFALTMMRYHQHIPLLYGVDLIGAGSGALSVMVLLQMFSAETTLSILAISGLSAGVFALSMLNFRQKRVTASLLLLAVFAILLLPQQWLKLQLSEYKGLAQTLLIKDTSLLFSHSSPVSQIDVVSSPLVPFRYAPGLSLQSPGGPPEQLAVFRDGDEMNAIDAAEDINSGDKSTLEYYDYMTSALPYHVHSSAQTAPKNTLILNSATGSQILQAALYDIPHIDAVEPDEQLSRLITEQYADYFGWQNLQHKTTIHTISPRGFAAAEKHYDIVVSGPSGASAGGAAGVHALSASYDYTVEAIQSYLKLLAPDGLLSITLWTSTPARDNLKLLATAVRAMKLNGITRPENNIAWIRSWNTATLLLKNTALTAAEISKVRDFSLSRSFDLAWLPGIRPDEVNRFQLLQQPVFYLTAQSIFSNAKLPDNQKSFIDSYKYDIHPATDNRPYFNNFFKWSSLEEFLSLPGRAGISMIGVGYPTLLVTLLQAAVAAFVLILLPLFFKRVQTDNSRGRRRNIIFYFFAIGLAFLFIELAFIQKFTLILSQPLYAVAVALCAFLIFSGMGSLYVQHRIRTAAAATVAALLRRSVMLIGLITVLYIIVLPLISGTIMALPEAMRILSAFILAAPLAFFMGMPYSLGLASVQQSTPELMPWAWGINGCASVLSAILAVLLAIHIGFNGVMLCAVALYIIAWLSNITNQAAP